MTEGFLQLGDRRTWYRSFGEPTDKPALLLLHGGPGGASFNDVPFVEEIARDRLVVQYDQLETGRSQRLGDVSGLTIDAHVAELDAVRDALHLTDVHVWGHSWGGMLAYAYALTQPQGLRSVIAASAPHSAVLYAMAGQRAKSELPPRHRRALDRCERTLAQAGPKQPKAGDGPTPAAIARQAAIGAALLPLLSAVPVQSIARAASLVPALRRSVYPILGLPLLRRHGVRTRITPGLVAGQVAMNPAVYEYLWGPSEFVATGPLSDFDVTDRLGDIAVPVLVTSGGHEFYTPRCVELAVARLRDVQWELFADAAHAPDFECPERYTNVLRDFLTKIDARP